MTDLIDRYLAAVARELPERERADITAELRDELMSGIEAREQAKGRPLTGDELRGELVAFGNPLVVAGRYRKVQHLVGPTVFPFWWAAMRAMLTVVAVVYVTLILLSVVADGHVSGLRLPSPVFVVGFATGVITLLCALAEHYGKVDRLARRWSPERLPAAGGKPASRFEVMTELAFAILFLLWWVGVIHISHVPWGAQLQLAPVWTVWFWPIAGYAAADVVASGLALARPDRPRLVGAVRIARDLAAGAILIGVLQASHWVDVSGVATSVTEVSINGVARGILMLMTATFLGRAAITAWKLRPGAPTPVLAP